MTRALLFGATLVACVSEPGRPAAPGPQPGTAPGAAPTAAGGQCGRPDGAPAVARRWQYSSSMPNARCDELATIWGNVAHSDRVCAGDSECRLVTGDGHCWSGALNQRGAARPEYREGPCGNPASGACAGPVGTARCVTGCCQVQ